MILVFGGLDYGKTGYACTEVRSSHSALLKTGTDKSRVFFSTRVLLFDHLDREIVDSGAVIR